MKNIKQMLHENIYLYDLALRFTYGSYNKKMTSFIEKISEIDSIQDYPQFRDAMKDIPELVYDDIYAIRRSYGENTLYGHAYNVLKYAGLNEKSMFYLPILEHGIPYSDVFNPEKYKLNNSFIFQGRNNEKQWKHSKKQAAYYIGPYIHYCDGIYDDETVKRIKEKNGYTALVFLPHSIETNQFRINVKKIIEEFNITQGMKIDTVLACVYCMDAPYIEEAETNSIKYVSAGFKLDYKFISRLKTILQLADVVYYSSYSSSMGYAYYMGKNIICNPSPKDIEDIEKLIDKSAAEKLVRMKELFGVDSKASEESKREFINEFWGLDEIKSPDEIRKIFNENRKRIRHKIGF